MTEPGAGSDLRGMKATAVEDGGDWVLNGTKHFISHADIADFASVSMASGEEDSPRGKRKKTTAFFVDKGTKGFTVRDGYRNVSHRGYTNSILEFNNCRVSKGAILGELHRGFDVANTWLGATRLQVAATCLGRAERALELSTQWAVDRVQFGQQIGKFQGVSFKLADMAVELRAAELLVLEAAWKRDRKIDTDMDMAIAAALFVSWVRRLPLGRAASSLSRGSVRSFEPESIARKSHGSATRCAASEASTRSRNSSPCQVGISTEIERIGLGT
jgi:acyl-CoA dehydrogenase